jgi:hypothetical protein
MVWYESTIRITTTAYKKTIKQIEQILLYLHSITEALPGVKPHFLVFSDNGLLLNNPLNQPEAEKPGFSASIPFA